MTIQSKLQEYAISRLAKNLTECNAYEILNLINTADRDIEQDEYYDNYPDDEYPSDDFEYSDDYNSEYSDEYARIEEQRAFTICYKSRINNNKLFIPVFIHENEAFLEIWKKRIT